MAVVSAAYRFENNMVMAFDSFGQQMPDLQGKYTPELLDKIMKQSNQNTVLEGFQGVDRVKYFNE